MTTMTGTIGWLFVAGAFSAVGCHSSDMPTKTAAAAGPAVPAPPPEAPPPAPERALVGLVERLEPALDDLSAPGARPQGLAQRYKGSGGPVWPPGALLASAVPQNVVWHWSETQ